MKYLSLFSGIGGFELGIQQALIYETLEEPTCVGYSEIDKYAIKVYERNFNGHKNYGDATTINPTELPDFDLLVGGFPCQAFSIAGKRKGFDDTRGTLFFDIARILAEKRPRHLVLENVKGLLSHDGGKTFQTILGVLSDLGYRVEWQVLNSKDFGVPQNRERIYFIGHLRGECSGEVLPIRQDGGLSTERQRQISPTITQRYYKQGQSDPYVVTGTIEQLNQPKHSNERVYGINGVSPTLNTMQGGNRQPFIAAQRGRENGQVLEPQLEDKTNTLTAVAKDNYVVDAPRIRRLTPLECERLQGFPDNWTEYGFDCSDPLVGDWGHWYGKTKEYGGTREEWERLTSVDISDTQRYKMCGNAVTVNTVQAVMEKLFKHEEEA